VRSGSPDRRSTRALMSLLFVYPIGLFRRNPAVLVVAVAITALNLVAPDQGVFTEILRRGWLFAEAPRLFASLFGSPIVLALAGVGFVGKNLLNVIVSQQLMLVFRTGRTTLRHTVRTARVDSFLWLTAAQGCAYSGCAACAGLAYLPCLLAWRLADVDLTIPLLAAAVLAYPAFDVVISTAIMIAVLPVPLARRTGLMRFVLRGRVFWPLYAYGAIRTVVEALLVGLAPLLLLDLVHNALLASATIALGLLLPFLLLRGATYALVLDLMTPDQDVRRVFAEHFDRTAISTNP
jgi:hypothetical protein